MDMKSSSGENKGWWGRGGDDSWSLRARLVIRPDGNDGGFSVTAEGSAGNSAAVPADSRLATAVDSATCSVTLNAGPNRTLTLTCNPTKPPQPPPSREVASQTSNSLIPHLLHQFQLNNNQVVGNELKKATNLNKRSPNYLKGDGNKKNPRTVHIDVYCTESSESEDESESVSTPRTVYQSDKSKVVHERMGPGSIPAHCLRRDRRREMSGSDVVSSGGYPSRVSSTVQSSFVSRDDMGSVDSLRLGGDSSVASLAQTDSFDYDNSTDKFRIMEKEKEWRAWRRPPQGSNDWATSEEEESSESSGPELAWSFAEADGGGLRRTDTVRHSSPPSSSLSDSDLIKRHPTNIDRIPLTFGPIIRRPNRHIGPTKNPNCSCNTCKFYFSNVTSPS